jgi:hypothetical protein
VKIYCEHESMQWYGGMRADLPENGITFSNYSAEVDDELANRLLLTMPHLFFKRKPTGSPRAESPSSSNAESTSGEGA